MPTAVEKLPVVGLDYTNRGPGLHLGLTQLEAALAGEQGRVGYLAVNVTVPGAVLPIVMARSDLYVMGFRSAGNWYRFDDAAWPFSDPATKLGFDGQYSTLGGLSGDLTAGAVAGIARLANPAYRNQWKDPLRTLLVVVSECARLIPVRMQVLGLLNGVVHTVPLASLARYIQNWDKASKGKDMSVEKGPNLRTGFPDPTIIKR